MFYDFMTEPASTGTRDLYDIPRLSVNLSIGFKVPDVIIIERGPNSSKALKAN